jgi:hypothetical protein
MTGLNLETFLQLLRADLGAWLSFAVIVILLALMAWTSWGSRRALRKCLAVSVIVHLSLVLYGSTLPALGPLGGLSQDGKSKEHIRQIRVMPLAEDSSATGATAADGPPRRRSAPWDRPAGIVALQDRALRPERPEVPKTSELIERAESALPPVSIEPAVPEVNPPEPPEPDRRPWAKAAEPPQAPAQVAPADPSEIKVVEAAPRDPDSSDAVPTPGQDRLRPDRIARRSSSVSANEPAVTRTRPSRVEIPAAAVAAPSRAPEARPTPARDPAPLVAVNDPDASTSPKPSRTPIAMALDPTSGIDRTSNTPRSASAPGPLVPEADLRRQIRSGAVGSSGNGSMAGDFPHRSLGGREPVALAPVTPRGHVGESAARSPVGGRPLSAVPETFRSRLDPNRSALAQRAGASPASEQAVERALEWLARHQDDDGRWDGGSAKGPIEGYEAERRESFTIHCPPDDLCKGECYYIEADTAMTGLALLAFLGAGYTHLDGQYAAPIGKGLDFLRSIQKPDGDLRGSSQAVGMYCHAMAALALCEAYALTGDESLRDPVERAVAFLVQSQARDGLSWRYAPGEPIGDTSILGWVVLVFKSAREGGVPVSAKARAGALGWLDQVAAGRHGGLASYQPRMPATPTMTAEAWVCRQFLGAAPAPAAGDEAAAFLLEHAPDRDPYNLYYWYYGTLALFQHGGDAWTRWNTQVRDQLVRRQRLNGHAAGSWDPDGDRYSSRGGRIYSTALAALTLEVYYRYLRPFTEPHPMPILAPTPDTNLRRAGR